MPKILEKIKDFFSGKIVYRSKKKEASKPQQESPKAEKKLEE